MENEKWYQSRRVWAAIIAGALGIYAIIRTVVAMFGIQLPELSSVAPDQVVNTIFGIMSTLSGILAFFSFLKPKK